MTPTTYTEKGIARIVECVRNTATLMNTSKSEMAIVLNVSERTIDNRFSGNIKTSFTISELLKLCFYWGIPLEELISPHSSTIDGLLEELEKEYDHTLLLLKKQLQRKELKQ